MTLNTYIDGSETPRRSAAACGAGRFVAQRFQQPAHAPRAARRAEQHRNAEAFAGLAREVLEHFFAGRGLVHQQLFEQLVVMVGELLEHVGARLGLALLEIGWDFDPLGFLARRDI